MTVSIAKNIKKERIFINKYGKQCTEEEMFGQRVGHDMGGDRRTDKDEQSEEKAE